MTSSEHVVCETRYCPGCGGEIFCRVMSDSEVLFYLSDAMDRAVEECPTCSFHLRGIAVGALSPEPPGQAPGPKKQAGKKDLVEAMLKSAGKDFSSKAAAGRALDAVGNALAEMAAQGMNVRWPGIGSFRIKERKARTGRNPQTGQTMNIPAKRVLTFTPAKRLKEQVEKGTQG